MWKTLLYNNEIYENLEINENGELRNKNNGKCYKQHLIGNGYLGVCISLGSRKNKKLFKIHRCVATTFIENPFDKPCVNHIDGDKLNNNVYNLEWVTSKENNIHAIKNHLHTYESIEHENNIFAKLKNENVSYIREVYKSGDRKFGCRALSRKFGVSKETIRNIVNNVSWKIREHNLMIK